MAEARARSRIVRTAAQLAGFVVGLALLAWCARMALSPENRARIGQLTDAPLADVALLMALSAATLVINGLAFRVVLAPVRSLRVLDVQAVNAVATLLAYLPFKLSLVWRVAIHNRRDGVALATIGAWFAALAVTMAAAIAPMILMSLARPRADALWYAGSVAGIAVVALAVVAIARVLRGERGVDRLERFAQRVGLAPLRRVLRSRTWSRLHDGFGMLADGRATAIAIALRAIDVAVQTARVLVAAGMLGKGLEWPDALVIAASYFLIGVVSPAGSLGTREAGATAIAGVLAVSTDAAREFVVAALLVSASEGLVVIACAAAGVAWLRPDRLLRVGARAADTINADAPRTRADQPDGR